MSLHYLVQWIEVGNRVKWNATVSTSPHVITELKMATEYKICVATMCDGVITECSKDVLVRTQELKGIL